MRIIRNNFFHLGLSPLFTWIVAASRGRKWAIRTTALSVLVPIYDVGIHSTVKVGEIWYIRHMGTTRVFACIPHQTIDFRILWFRSKLTHTRNGEWSSAFILRLQNHEKWIVFCDGQTPFSSTGVCSNYIVSNSLWQHLFLELFKINLY